MSLHISGLDAATFRFSICDRLAVDVDVTPTLVIEFGRGPGCHGVKAVRVTSGRGAHPDPRNVAVGDPINSAPHPGLRFHPRPCTYRAKNRNLSTDYITR